MEAIIRLLPTAAADGAANMAADEALVHSAAKGVASLRFYGWAPATLSLGYFQPASVRLTDPRLAILPWVRRPSGGATLVHHHELTYALALPAGPPWHVAEPWLQCMHRIIALALADLGLRNDVETVAEHPAKHGEVLCFQQYTAGDLLCAGKKIVGSAQRKYRRALLQHGSILLAQSEHTPALPGLRELTGRQLTFSAVQEALRRCFSQDTGWRMEADDWTAEELSDREELIKTKYTAPSWNEKR